MSDKVRYERKSKALFENLGLTGASYRHAANRKQKLVPGSQGTCRIFAYNRIDQQSR